MTTEHNASDIAGNEVKHVDADRAYEAALREAIRVEVELWQLLALGEAFNAQQAAE